MTDARHITHDPKLAALRAQITRVEAALDVLKRMVDQLAEARS